MGSSSSVLVKVTALLDVINRVFLSFLIIRIIMSFNVFRFASNVEKWRDCRLDWYIRRS